MYKNFQFIKLQYKVLYIQVEDSEEEKKNYEQLKAMAKEAVGFVSIIMPRAT